MLGEKKIFGHGCSNRDREAAVADLNTGRVQGMVMSERIGGIGHNLIGASVMLFMGSYTRRHMKIKPSVCSR